MRLVRKACGKRPAKVPRAYQTPRTGIRQPPFHSPYVESVRRSRRHTVYNMTECIASTRDALMCLTTSFFFTNQSLRWEHAGTLVRMVYMD